MSRLKNFGLAAGLASLAFASAPAWANTVEEPGETSGIAAYAPLPEGGYFLNLGNFGVRNTHPNTGLAVDIPALVWSTPWTILGARLEFLLAQPVIDLNVNNTTSLYGVYYPFVQPILTWDLGGGFSFGGGVGAYLPIRNSVTKGVVGRITTVRFNAGINYIDKEWTLAATGAFGLPEGTDNENPAGHHQWAIIDLTANYSIGKWQVGLGGYGSDDTSEPPGVPGYKQQAQFAVGPLVGYNFGPVILQAKLTRDVVQQNEGGFDTRFWTNLIIPLWGAPPPPPPVTGAPPPAPVVEAPPTRTYLVFFDWDRADLSSRAQQIIGEAASASTRVHTTRIMCNGYTDTSGTAKYNLALSMRRANNVANELVKDGVPRDVIDIKGFGETHPLVQTGPGVREPQNRRVEIILS
jgi:outer membrane protein OmpA-like peptidoglycan-associated protein